MNFRDYVLELLRNHGDSTTRQVRDYLPPDARKEMNVDDVQSALEDMALEGVIVRVNRYWRSNVRRRLVPSSEVSCEK